MFAKWILNLDFVQRKMRESFNEGFAEARAEQQRMRDFEREEHIKNYLHPGGEVLMVSNEWEVGNLTHGVVIGMHEKFQDLPLVRNVETNETLFGNGLVVPYHPELHAALKKLNPFERWSLMIARAAKSKDAYIFNKNKIDPDVEC